MKTLIASTLAVAAIAAAPAAAAPVTIAPSTGAEGAALSVPISHTCGAKKGCRYTVTTVDGTARAGADFTAAPLAGRTKKGGTYSVTLSIPTVDDNECESDETFSVQVNLVNKNGTFAFDAAQTITDRADCDEPPLPMSVPEPPEGSKVETTRTFSGVQQTCETQTDYGTPSPGSSVFYQKPCYVHVYCPKTVNACTGSGSTQIRASGAGAYTRGNVNAGIPSGGQFIRQERQCAAYGSCKAEVTGAAVKPGEFLIVECSGGQEQIRVPPGGDREPPTQSSILCTASLAFSV